jgi:ATP-binding cassette subfamily B (MDR/TAP) protein 11
VKDEIIIEEDVEPAPIFKVIKLNLPEWRWMLIGSIGSSLTGAFPFVFALILGELMGVSGVIWCKNVVPNVWADRF